MTLKPLSVYVTFENGTYASEGMSTQELEGVNSIEPAR